VQLDNAKKSALKRLKLTKAFSGALSSPLNILQKRANILSSNLMEFPSSTGGGRERGEAKKLFIRLVN
jgi:hypothetical protein